MEILKILNLEFYWEAGKNHKTVESHSSNEVVVSADTQAALPEPKGENK